jgi:hypothetical protein
MKLPKKKEHNPVIKISKLESYSLQCKWAHPIDQAVHDYNRNDLNYLKLQ